jgi:hypothetical protein
VERPEPIPNIDQEKIKKAAGEYLDILEAESEGKRRDDLVRRDDFDYYLFELVMDECYGPNVWDFINERSG